MRVFFAELLGLSRRRKLTVALVTDVVLATLSFAFAIALRLDSFALLGQPRVWLALAVALPVAIVTLRTFGLYRAVIRYITAPALRSVMIAAAVSSMAMGLAISLFSLPVPRSVPLLFGLLFFMSVGASRYAFRELVQRALSRSREPVAIYGCGEAGRQVAQALIHGTDFLPVAFIDADPRHHGNSLVGLPVYGLDRVEMLIRTRHIRSIVLALPPGSKQERNAVLSELEQFPLHLRSIPGLQEVNSGKARIDQINDIGIEDLLGRDPVPPLDPLLGLNTRSKVVMVTGAGGSIGAELCRQILRQSPACLVLYEMSEIALYSIEQDLSLQKAREDIGTQIIAVLGSVRNPLLVSRTMRQFKVQTVYHAAAYKHVPIVEYNMTEGILNNVMGNRIVLEAAINAGVEAFTLISTDKAVRPTNIMGASKRLAELTCQAFSHAPYCGRTTVSMVRFGNVLGSSGSVIPLFNSQIAAGGPITVTHPEITRFFMTIPEAAQLVIQAGAMAQSGDVFLLDMGEPVRISELAARMARLHGLTPVMQTPGMAVRPGEIGLVFTHLRPGEKLFEELHVGGNVQPTLHPRIVRASESHIPMQVLRDLLAELEQACERNDTNAIRRILIEAKTDYHPHSQVVDHFASEADRAAADPEVRGANEAKRLTVVRN